MSRLLCFLLFVFTLAHCRAQRDRFSMQDGFVFPGEADRPEKFPLNPGSGGRFTTPPPVNPTSTTLSPSDIASCIQRCPKTSEYNPVCGTDNVLYNNPSGLSCARACSGIPLEVRKYGQCTENIRG